MFYQGYFFYFCQVRSKMNLCAYYLDLLGLVIVMLLM